MVKIGITERGDAGLDFRWMRTAKDYDGVVLITKHLSHKFIEEAARINSIVHATITGHGGTIYEPNIPNIIISKIYFELLVKIMGPERVILRIDPIIPTNNGIAIAINVYEQFHIKSEKKTRVRISFMDNYPHVKERFIKAGLKPLDYNFHAPIELRKKIASYFPDAEICGEPEMECVGCISERDLKIFGIDAVSLQGYDRLKAVQRPECKCLIYKTEMLKTKGQCQHGCIYCYWK